MGGGLIREGGGLNIGFTVSIETVSCRSSVANNGKHGHGLKLEKPGPIIITINFFSIIMVSSP